MFFCCLSCFSCLCKEMVGLLSCLDLLFWMVSCTQKPFLSSLVVVVTFSSMEHKKRMVDFVESFYWVVISTLKLEFEANAISKKVP